jgi:hypothetical protein
MQSTYLIFIDPRDVYNYVTITCKLEELVATLLDNEMLTTADEFKLVNWVIFKDSTLLE